MAEYDRLVDEIIADELPKLMAQPLDMSVLAGSSLSGPHSPSTDHPSTGKGVQIATDPGPAPRHGGGAFFCTALPHGGV
jgi:hypothetical protein